MKLSKQRASRDVREFFIFQSVCSEQAEPVISRGRGRYTSVSQFKDRLDKSYQRRNHQIIKTGLNKHIAGQVSVNVNVNVNVQYLSTRKSCNKELRQQRHEGCLQQTTELC